MDDSPIIREWTAQARQEGFEQGFREGLEEGLREAIARRVAAARLEESRACLLEVLRERFGDPVPDDFAATIDAQSDPAVLCHWTDLALLSPSYAVFQIVRGRCPHHEDSCGGSCP